MRLPFLKRPDEAALTCRHVLEEGAPVLYCSHDAEDGMRQFLCGGMHETNDARVVSLKEALRLDRSLARLRSLPPDCIAERADPRSAWVIRRR